MMNHQMKLNPQPFSMIKKGLKTIELRLYDEKRRLIKAGDTIIFSNTEHPDEQITARVMRLHLFDNFAELYQSLPLDKCGYLPEELRSASPADMNIYYPDDLQRQYGVVGIELQLIDRKERACI